MFMCCVRLPGRVTKSRATLPDQTTKAACRQCDQDPSNVARSDTRSSFLAVIQRLYQCCQIRQQKQLAGRVAKTLAMLPNQTTEAACQQCYQDSANVAWSDNKSCAPAVLPRLWQCCRIRQQKLLAGSDAKTLAMLQDETRKVGRCENRFIIYYDMGIMNLHKCNCMLWSLL